MKHLVLSLALIALPVVGHAEPASENVRDIVIAHILPRFAELERRAEDLAQAAAQDCAPESAPLRAAYGAAFDMWIAVSHLRFGPTEQQDRAYALAFWPDSRGATPRALSQMITKQDAIVGSQDSFAQVSIAARGFYALEFLLYDSTITAMPEADYRCSLVRAIARDIVALATAINAEWRNGFAAQLLQPSPQGRYRSDLDAQQELFKALSSGLEFTADSRLGRPLGSFDNPRPQRAEAWRSGRSARHVEQTLTSLRDLSMRLAQGDPALVTRIASAFDRALAQVGALNDPVFAGVSDPQNRIRIEALQNSVAAIRILVRAELGPKLGVAAGFNALDGD